MDILIEEADSSIWVAALDKGRLDGLEIDPATEEVRWGSIYRAKVKTIDPALDAVFVDLDGENTGILYNNETRAKDENGAYKKGGETAIGKMFQPGDMITVQAKSAYLPKSTDSFLSRESKIPQVSMDITLPGRYLIYCPLVEANRVSVRIRNKPLRKQLLKMMDQMEGVHGCIVRAAASGTQTDVLVREGKILMNIWQEMQPHLEIETPQLIMQGPDAVQRSLSDQATKQIEHIEVVTMDHFHQAEEWCAIFAPDLVTKIVPVELDNASEDLALFDYRDIIGQIEDIFQPYAMLPGGGNIIIQETAALTAIDINKGADKRSNLAVNIEAAKEVARQMRIRNMGGIVVVDFLRSSNRKDEGKLIAALEEAVLQDPCTVQLHGRTSLGLYEITRKRRTPPLNERFDGMFE